MANRNKKVEMQNTEIDTSEKRTKKTYAGVGTEEFTIEDYPYGEFKTISSEDELKQGTSSSPTILDINELFEKGIVKRGDTIDLSELPDITTIRAASQEQLDMLTASSKEQITAIHLSNNTPIGMWFSRYGQDYDNKYVMDRQLDLSSYRNVTEVETHDYLNNELEDIILPEKTTSLLCCDSMMENLSREGSLKNTDIELMNAEIAGYGSYADDDYYSQIYQELGRHELVGIDIPPYELLGYVQDHPVLSTTKHVDKILNEIRTRFRDNKLSGCETSALYMMMKREPRLTDKVFKTFGLQSYKKNVPYESLFYIVETRSDLADKILGGMAYMGYEEYKEVSRIAQERPELAGKVIDVYKISLQSGKRHLPLESFKSVCETLSSIARARPDLADKVFDVYRIALQSDKNSEFSFAAAYRSLSDIADARPELTGDVLSICKEGIKSKDGDQVRFATNCIKTIANNNPDAIRDYLGMTDKDVQSVDVAELLVKTKDKLHKKDATTEITPQQPETSNSTNVVSPNKGKSGYGD